MTWRSTSIPPVPEATAAAVKAAFPKGNIYVDLHKELGSIYRDDRFADCYADRGHPVDMAPWRLALATVMQYMEGLTDRQTAAAVRRCMDWKYALSLELTDPGFDFTLLHDFRQRLLSQDGAQRLLDTLLDTCEERGWIKTRGKQRTDSTYVVAAIRRLYELECVQQAMHHALNELSEVAPQWVLAWTETLNLPTHDGAKAMKCVAWTAMHAGELKAAAGVSLKGRKAMNGPVYSCSLSWEKGAAPSDGHMRETGLASLGVLGLSGHEAVLIRHTDTEHDHLHIVVNLVHPETGRWVKLSNDRLKLSEWAERYEREHG